MSQNTKSNLSNISITSDKKDTEVAALLSADMKDEKYYQEKLKQAQNIASPRYRGFVEANMEYQRNPIVGPIGLPDMQMQHKKQTLIKGKPVKPEAELIQTKQHPDMKDELLYLGEDSKVQKPKPANHANLARQRVQQKTSTERIAMERAHNDMQGYLSKYNDEKRYKQNQEFLQKQKDMDMLKNYNPFGKPGGGAPIKTKSGRDLPQLNNDFEIRFKDNDYNKKMVEIGKRYRNDFNKQSEYQTVLDKQIQDRKDATSNFKNNETEQEIQSMKYNPFGKPGGGAPRNTDTIRHWSKLEPQNSLSVVDEKRNRLRLQAQDNLSKSAELRTQGRQGRYALKREFDNAYNPWGKGYGNPKFDREGNVDVRFGMKTHYDIFNKIPIVTTHSGMKFGGWPLPINPEDQTEIKSIGDGLHSQGSGPPPTQPRKRGGLLSRRFDENFVTEKTEEQPPMLNGKEAKLLQENKMINEQTKRHNLIKVQNQSIVVPQTATENPQKVDKPSAGTLKRELDDANKSLNLQINDNYSNLENPVTVTTADRGDSPVPMEHPTSKCSHNRNISFSPGTPTTANSLAYSPRQKQSSQDVADWMRSTCLSHPRRDPTNGLIKPTRRITSDVTRHRLDLRTPQNSKLYHEELSDQVKERKMRDNQHRNNELESEKNWDNNLIRNFGKPGGGAPSSLGAARRQFSNPSLMPQEQLGSKIPYAPYGLDNINSNFGGAGHGAPNDKGYKRRVFSNAAIVPGHQLGTNTPKITGDKPTTVASLLNTEGF
jgi:hypothetical protein